MNKSIKIKGEIIMLSGVNGVNGRMPQSSGGGSKLVGQNGLEDRYIGREPFIKPKCPPNCRPSMPPRGLNNPIGNPWPLGGPSIPIGYGPRINPYGPVTPYGPSILPRPSMPLWPITGTKPEGLKDPKKEEPKKGLEPNGETVSAKSIENKEPKKSEEKGKTPSFQHDLLRHDLIRGLSKGSKGSRR